MISEHNKSIVGIFWAWKFSALQLLRISRSGRLLRLWIINLRTNFKRHFPKFVTQSPLVGDKKYFLLFNEQPRQTSKKYEPISFSLLLWFETPFAQVNIKPYETS